MPNLNVSYHDLDNAASRLAAGREEISATLTRLQSQIASLVSGGFVTDRTSPAYTEAYNRFTSGANNAISGLDDLARFLRVASQTLMDVDAQLASRLAR
jgi:WXG100 family type VII secretion target